MTEMPRSFWMLRISSRDLGLDRHVQCRGGLIADEAGRGREDRAMGNDHALAHTAGQLMGVILHPFFRIGDAHLLQQLQCLL